MPKKKTQIFDKGNPDELFEKHECLGEGTYGTVWTGMELSTKRTCAIKIVKLDDDLEEIKQEVAIMKESESPFIVKFYGCYWGKRREMIWMVMEHCIAGSLNDLMYVCDTTLTEAQIRAVVAAMVLGLEYLHKHLIIHRDIKAGNVLLTGEGHVRLADFGVSAKMKNKSDRRTTAIGAPFWMAPEVILEKKYDGRADIWSVGITVIELAESRPPNSHINPMRALFLIPKSPPPKLKKPQDYTADMNNFVKECLTVNMNKRPTATQLKKRSFVEAEIKEFQQNNTSAAVKSLVTKSLDKIQSWRQEQFAEDDDSDESSDDEDSISGLLDDMDRKTEQAQAKKAPEAVRNVVQNRGPPTGGPKEPAPTRYMSPYGDARVRDSVRESERTYVPLRDVAEPTKGNEKGRMMSHNAQAQISEDAVMNMIGMDEEDGENPMFAAVMTKEFISVVKRVYEQHPEAFGEEDEKLTSQVLTKGLANVFTGMVEQMGGELGKSQLNLEDLDFGDDEEFDNEQFEDDGKDEKEREPPPPPFLAAGGKSEI